MSASMIRRLLSRAQMLSFTRKCCHLSLPSLSERRETRSLEKVRHPNILSIRKEGILMSEVLPYSNCNTRGPIDFPNTLPRLYRQDVPSRRESRSHKTVDFQVPDIKPTRTDGREDPMKSRGIKEYASLGCILDSAYQRRPLSVALRHRDALFSGPAKDTETLHVPVVHPGIRRLITVSRASDRPSPETVYFQMSRADGYAPWPYFRDAPAINQRLAADWPGLAIDTARWSKGILVSTPRNPGQVLECAKPTATERTDMADVHSAMGSAPSTPLPRWTSTRRAMPNPGYIRAAPP